MSSKSDLVVIGCDPVGFEIAFSAAGLGARVRLVPQDRPPTTGQRARLLAVGVAVDDQPARFVDRKTLMIGEERAATRWIVIANGSESPELPFATGTGPRHVVIGDDARAVACATAWLEQQRDVTLVCPAAFLPEFEAEHTALLRLSLEAAGMTILAGHGEPILQSATPRLELGNGHGIPVSELGPVIRTGTEQPRWASLGVGSLGLNRPVPDHRLLLPGTRIFVVGESLGMRAGTPPPRNQIGLVLGQALYGQRTPADAGLASRFVECRPGLAEFGLLPQRLGTKDAGSIRILRAFRAAAAGQPAASLIVVTDRKARVLGASAFGVRAPELNAALLAMASRRIPLTELASLTLSPFGDDDLLAQVARQPLVERLKSRAARRLMQFCRLFS